MVMPSPMTKSEVAPSHVEYTARHCSTVTSCSLPATSTAGPTQPAVKGASSVTCAAYSVSCIPGTSPARGLVRQWPELQRYTPRDFCDSGGSAFVAMPPQIGARHLVQAEPQCTCPSTPLLPNQGRGVLPLTPCTAGTSYHLLQCSRHPLAPLPAAAAAAGGAAARSGRVVDVLLAVSDNAGHGLFATVRAPD